VVKVKLFCAQCGRELDDTVNFCPHCGSATKNIDSAYVKGIHYFCEGEYKQALEELLSASKINPNNPELIKDCGHTYLHSGNPDKAYEYYSKALTLNDKFPDAHFNLAIILLNKRKLNEALNHLEKIQKNHIHLVKGKFYLGLIFSTIDIFFAEVNFYIGLVYKEISEYEKSVKYFENATELNKYQFPAHHNLADVYLKLKEYQKAIRQYKEVIDLEPFGSDLLETHNNLGIAYYENGQIEDAIREFNWVLMRDPGNPNAVYNLDQIYEKEGIYRKPSEHKGLIDYTEVATPIFELAKGIEVKDIEDAFVDKDTLQIIGRSKIMKSVVRTARIAAASDSTVLITGENGTGKELITRVMYLNSMRRDKPLVTINCTTLPEGLLESELFGHEKGAFTGAYSKKIGRFELANHGTIFLDEIGELTPKLQVKLLRILQEKEFERVGGTETIKVDVRLIAATNRNLNKLIAEGLFREDLFYRLNVIPIYIPPLRERKEDIPLLVGHFQRKYLKKGSLANYKISEEEMNLLTEYHWPGNVRELENIIERACVMGTQISALKGEITRAKKKEDTKTQGEDVIPEEDISLEELEKQYILKTLKKTNNNHKLTAQLLGINPSTLWRKIKKYDIKID
jgi:DNA-binding NtrC family response regulator/Tfp pilus assembly protein PilF